MRTDTQFNFKLITENFGLFRVRISGVRAGVGAAHVTRGQGQSLEAFEVPEVKPVKPSIEHLAWNRGGDFLTPKLLLVSTILTKLVINN